MRSMSRRRPGALARARARNRGSSNRRCAISCTPWVTRVGNNRRLGTAARSRSVNEPFASRGPRMRAVATASCTARLIPTPPIGDIACAASPMSSAPGTCHSRTRFTLTVNNAMSSHVDSSSTRSRRSAPAGDLLAGLVTSPRSQVLEATFGDDVRALVVVAAVDGEDEAAGADPHVQPSPCRPARG